MSIIKLYEEFYWDNLYEGDDDDKKSTDRSPLDNKSVETGLKNKGEETGVSMGILRAIFRRGMAAWKGGHRPGIGQNQWAYARVNSFLTKGKGTWGKADKDLAKEVRDDGGLKKESQEYFKGISQSTINKKKAQMSKQAKMDDDDPEAYKEMPGDKKGANTQKTSKHTKKYQELYGDKGK